MRKINILILIIFAFLVLLAVALLDLCIMDCALTSLSCAGISMIIICITLFIYLANYKIKGNQQSILFTIIIGIVGLLLGTALVHFGYACYSYPSGFGLEWCFGYVGPLPKPRPTPVVESYVQVCEAQLAKHPEWLYFNTVNSDLQTDSVSDLFIDDAGNIWIATNLGVSKFNHEKWLKYSLEHIEAINSAPDGRIWGTAAGNGVYVWTGYEWKSAWQEFVSSIAFDHNNRVWIGTKNGVIIMDAESLNLLHTLTFDDLFIGDTAQVGIDPLGQVHVNYSGDEYLFDVDSFLPLDGNAYPVGEDKRFFTSDSSGYAWFLSFDELVRSDGETVTSYTPDNSSLPSLSIYDLKIDPEGLTWLSTHSNQIAYLDNGKWITVVNDPFGWGENQYNRFPFDFDQDGNLWFGFAGFGTGCGVIMIPRTSMITP